MSIFGVVRERDSWSVALSFACPDQELQQMIKQGPGARGLLEQAPEVPGKQGTRIDTVGFPPLLLGLLGSHQTS